MAMALVKRGDGLVELPFFQEGRALLHQILGRVGGREPIAAARTRRAARNSQAAFRNRHRRRKTAVIVISLREAIGTGIWERQT